MSQGYIQTDEQLPRSQRAGIRRAERASVWTERMVQALGTRVEWYSLYDKVCEVTTLERAWQRVKKNGGVAGVDGVTVERFGRTLEKQLQTLADELQTKRYEPQAIKRVEIPKVDGGTRALGIPTVRDRVVQGALREVIEPIFEVRFKDCSYGFRPGRGCKDALRAVQQAVVAGHLYVVDADIKSYFDSIPHDKMLSRCHVNIKDGAVMDLIGKLLKQRVLSEMKSWEPEQGTPQGGVMSPLLANIYMHTLDELLTERGYQVVRYADDVVVLCRDAKTAEAALRSICGWVAASGLQLHPEKTRIANLSEAGGYFDFLGYRFYADSSGKVNRTIKPKKVKLLYKTLASMTKRTTALSTTELITTLNRWLRGVFEYFKHSEARALATLDAHVRYRLRRILAKRCKWKGAAKHWAAHQRWRNQYFHDLGLFSLATNRAIILHSHSGHI